MNSSCSEHLENNYPFHINNLYLDVSLFILSKSYFIHFPSVFKFYILSINYARIVKFIYKAFFMRKRTIIRKVFSVIKSNIWDSLLQIYYKETLYLPFICWQQWSILLLLCTQLLNIAHSEHDMKIPFHCIIHSCLNILLNMHLTYNQGVTTMCQSNAQFQDVG